MRSSRISRTLPSTPVRARLLGAGKFRHTTNSHPTPLYLLGIPFFIFVYASIIAAEENFLREKFGAEYEAYCERVNRIWPNWKGFRQSIEGMRFNWRRLAIREYGTMFGLAVAFVDISALTLYRELGDEALPDILAFLRCSRFTSACAT